MKFNFLISFTTIFLLSQTVFATANLTFFLSSAAQKNGTFRSAFNQYLAAKERLSGRPGLYMPTLVTDFTRSDQGQSLLSIPTNPFNFTNSTAYNFSAALKGSWNEAGLDYNFAVYQNSQTSYYVWNQSLGDLNAGVMELDITVHLLKGFGPWVGSIPADRLQYNERQSYWQFRSSWFDVAQNVLEAYIDVLVASKKYIKAKQFVSASEGLVEKYNQRQKVGNASGLDVLNVQNQLQTTRAEYVAALNAKLDAIRSLYKFASYEMRPKEDDEFADLPLREFSVPSEWLDEKTKPELQANPKLESLHYAILLSTLDVKDSSNKTLPAVDFIGKFLRQTNLQSNLPQLFQSDFAGSTYTIEIQYPIGTFAERAESRARVAENAANQANYDQQHTELIADWLSLVSEMKNQEQLVTLTKEGADISSRRYNAALPTLQLNTLNQKNVIDYLNSYHDSVFSLLEAENNLLKIRSKLYYLRGDSTLLSAMGAFHF